MTQAAVKKEASNVIVLARTGYGADWQEVYHVNKARGLAGKAGDIGQGAAKKEAIEYIRKHRSGGQGMEYRIKDMATGAILD